MCEEVIEQGVVQVTYKLPNKSRYVARLKRMVKARRGKLDDYILAQIERAAGVWMNVDRVESELAQSPTLLRSVGSTGQDRWGSNPLYETYNKLNRTLLDFFKGLGLNFSVSPENVNEADTDTNADDPLARMLKGE